MPPPAATLKVTVAIPTYNRADFLRQTLAGLVAQQFPREHFEILVIDNNSTDHTAAVVAEFASAKPTPRYLCEEKQGLDYGRNRAIAEARGEIIVFGDDDILVKPDWLAQMAVPLIADSGARKVGAVGGEVIPVFPDGLPDWVREWHAPLAFRADLGPIPAKHSPMGANLAFPKWVFEQLGPFHTALDRAAGNYFSGGDSEMIRRVRAAGLQVWFAPGADVQHQMPASRTTFRYASRHAFDSARSRVIDSRRPAGRERLLRVTLYGKSPEGPRLRAPRTHLCARLPNRCSEKSPRPRVALVWVSLPNPALARRENLNCGRGFTPRLNSPMKSRRKAAPTVTQAPLTISVVVVARNEAQNLSRCLASVHGWAAEIVVVLNDTTDSSESVAQSFGAHVSHLPWQGYRDTKNAALALASHPWVLSLDADEEVSPALRESLVAFFARPDRDQFAGARFPAQSLVHRSLESRMATGIPILACDFSVAIARAGAATNSSTKKLSAMAPSRPLAAICTTTRSRRFPRTSRK